MAARIQQRVLSQRSRGDNAHHITPHNGLRAALLSLHRGLRLLADGDPEAVSNETVKVGLVTMHGHAAHGDVLALVLATLGQRDVQRRCRFHGVFKEQFVEIAHAIEQEAVRVIGFDAQKLRHHGRDATLRNFRWRWWRY